jgi:hypothetical protein
MRALTLIALTLVALTLASTGVSAAPTPSFRWSAGNVGCNVNTGEDMRATAHACLQVGAFLVVATRATSTDPMMSVVRYNGEYNNAPKAWTTRLDLKGDPVVAIAHGKVVVIAVVVKDAIELVSLDAADGRRLRSSTTTFAGVARVQLGIAGASLQLYARASDGRGRSVALDPLTLATTAAPRDTPARAIREAMDRSATPSDGAMKVGTIESAWDEAELVVRKVGGWTTTVIDDRLRGHNVTLHAVGDRVYLTAHPLRASGAAAYAFDATSGKQLWMRHLTGIGPVVHSHYHNRVSSFVDGDVLVVQGVENGGNYICTVSIADGTELACVDNVPAAATFAPAAPRVTLVPLSPDQPSRPEIKAMSCVKSSTRKRSLVAKPGAGMSTGKTPKPITWVDGTVVFPSASCKPQVGGGITGDLIRIVIHDGEVPLGAATCECTLQFRTATNKDSRVVIATVRGAAEVGRVNLRP